MKPMTKAGFTVRYRDDGIIHYHFDDITRATIDAWVEVAHQHDLEANESGKHLLRLNTAHQSVIPSPYALARASYLDKNSPRILESQAFVLSNQLAYYLVAAFMNRLPDRKLKSALRIFKNEEDAIRWLQQRLSTEKSE